MFIVSPFTPLFFNPSKDIFGACSKYVQIFAPTDQIFVEVITVSEINAITGKIIDLSNNSIKNIDWKVWSMNSTDKLYYHVISNLPEGCYLVEVNEMRSEPFRITKDESELNKTTLIQYSMKDNKQRKDGVFWISETQYFFDFRAPGGFKDDNWVFAVANEQFTTADDEIAEVYSMEYTQKQFTLGNAQGCPIWYGDLLNKILSCSYVYFDGERYVRKDASVPEITQEIETTKSYIFKILLQRTQIIDYVESENRIKIRRVDDTQFRNVGSKLLMI